MSFCALPVFLAFLLNRCSIRFFTSCRCILGFTPFSASMFFGLSLVALLLKHPELYPCWLRRINCKLMFLYELFASLIFIEIGFCLWNSIETLLFFKIPAFMEEHCNPVGEIYIRLVETEVGVSVVSNILALSLLMFTLHITRVCNFSLLFSNHGVHKFFADAGLTSKLCPHHRDLRKESMNTCGKQGSVCSPIIIGDCCPSPRQQGTLPCQTCILPKRAHNRCVKTLRSGKQFY